MLGGDCAPKAWAVWPENWPAVQVFVAASTQWRWHEAQRLGLIYSELRALMAMMGVTDEAACLMRLRIMEAEVLGLCAKKR